MTYISILLALFTCITEKSLKCIELEDFDQNMCVLGLVPSLPRGGSIPLRTCSRKLVRESPEFSSVSGSDSERKDRHLYWEHDSMERINWLMSSTLCRKTPHQSCLPCRDVLSQTLAWEGSVAGQLQLLWQADQRSRVQLTRPKKSIVSLTWPTSVYARAPGSWEVHYQQHQQGHLLHDFLSAKPSTSCQRSQRESLMTME